ncbi:MAG TPA: ABC transporter permease [Solirubrobacteraceae bacterium]|jgi:phospholipid/cholesterol/gamma-HCH transport system permease protein|nr:ABC transporter permease [Solirubrobacteraceae bacterium]
MAESIIGRVGEAVEPARAGLAEFGDMGRLTALTIASAVRPPYPYGKEFVRQFLFTLRLTWFPMIAASLALTYGPAGVQAANFLNVFGAFDRLGGLFVIAVIREFAPLVCAVVAAGVAGTAITADLGARKIREELDALAVLGVDPIKNLVVPRFLALASITALYDIYAIFFGTLGGVLITLQNHQPLAPFFSNYFANATPVEFAGSLIKTALFGGIVAIVCCYKGMTASGGAEGVGRAVNQAVVIAFLGIGTFNYVFTQTLLATHPQLSMVR